MTVVTDHEAVAQRAEELEREAAREMRIRAEARAVAGYEPTVEETDGSKIIVADDGSAVATDGGETQPIDVGDHVEDEQNPDATMVVVNLDTLQADAYEMEDGPTVADVNTEYPPDDDVVEVVYPNRKDLTIEGKKKFAFPKSRLEVVHRVHDRDGDDGGEK
ncbi:hypothetical protein [Natrinema salsiterrestre]|uniref:Uncharacterized protein n=1 Tax=Natrinema salsiterrestre TaxID=2950540 RepID=A0A9Q4L4Z8_9EURY|nr:hypothetical protein [Natrinema salsiterrestre]MDF9748416.1 hypothetical protein [Natrinema salsiterrestre]